MASRSLHGAAAQAYGLAQRGHCSFVIALPAFDLGTHVQTADWQARRCPALAQGLRRQVVARDNSRARMARSLP